MWILALTIVALLLGFFLLGRRRYIERRSAEMATAAPTLGWRNASSQGEELRRMLEGFPLVWHGRDVRVANVLRGEKEDAVFFVADCGIEMGRGTRRHRRWESIVLVQAPYLKLPVFDLQGDHLPSVLRFRVLRWLAVSDVRSTTGLSEVTVPARPSFSRRFLLFAKNPEEVTRRFCERILAGLEELPELSAPEGIANELFQRDSTYSGNQPLLLSIQGCEHGLLAYVTRVRIQPAQMESFVNLGLRAAALFREEPELLAAPVHDDGSRRVVNCPECGRRYDVSAVLGQASFDHSAAPGQQMKCEDCGTLFTLG